MSDAEGNQFTLDQKLIERLIYLKYESLTLSQELTLPYIIAKHNVIMNAQTGSGKTLGFLLPIIHNF